MYRVTYHEKVISVDMPKLSSDVLTAIRKAIEKKLAVDPIRFGKYLKNALHPFRSIRVGNYRVIFSLEKNREVFIVLIEHRSIAYKVILKRI